MKTSQILRWCMWLCPILGLTLPADASWYALLIGAEGSNQSTFSSDVVAVQGGLTSGRWQGYNLPGHTLTLHATAAQQASTANIAAQLRTLNALMASDPDPYKYLFFYYSGHGGTSTLTTPNELVPPAINSPDEFLAVNSTTQDYLYDDYIDDLIVNNVPNATHKLFMIDACKSGGFFNGNDTGDLEKLAKTTLIASAQENQNAPMQSLLEERFVDLLWNRTTSATAAQVGQATGYSNLTFTGGRRDEEGEASHFGDWLTEEAYSSYLGGYDEGLEGMAGFTYVPEPAALGMLALGSLLLTRRKRETRS